MKEFEINKIERQTLINICRLTLLELFDLPIHSNHKIDEITPALMEANGAFVSLYNNGKLRGCIGRFNSQKPLVDTVKELVRSSALNDYRFNPVLQEEVSELEIEISVLSPLEKISSIDEITLGKHGIYIKKGNCSGTFLPQVALKTNWNREEFVGHCSRDKAGLGWYGWKDADLFRYEAIIINETEAE